MVPVVVSISYVSIAIVAVLGGLLALHGKADIGSLAKLPCLCPPGGASDQPVHPSRATSFSSARRCGACLRREPGARKSMGKSGTGQRKGENGALAVCEETTGRWAWKRPDGTMTELKGRCAF